MTTIQPRQLPLDDNPLVLEGISWKTYEQLLRDVEDSGQNLRITYDQGRMSIVSPLPRQEKWKSLLAGFIEVIADERNIPISTFGTTTWKRKDKRRGIEADECFYILHEPQVRGKLDFDLKRDPPPDLAIEVDVRRHPLDRSSVYAALGVPEVWQFDGERIEVLILQSDGTYQTGETSAAFSFLRPMELKQFLDLYGTTDQNSILRAVRAWIRTVPS